ncbi:MAG: hypothetical protein Q9220_001367 [cf. Caloplaca sp. 1 TL-2023]
MIITPRNLISLVVLASISVTGALQTPTPASVLQNADQTIVSVNAKQQLRSDNKANESTTNRCENNNITLCAEIPDCKVAGTQTVLKFLTTFERIPAYAMQEILNGAQNAIRYKLLTIGDRTLEDREIPWVYYGNRLALRADTNGWSWRMLNNTIAGIRQCLFRKGVFEEVYINSVDDPTALRSDAMRHLSLLKYQIIETGVNGTLPPGMERCFDPDTGTRLLYEVGASISGYNMQEILDTAERLADFKIAAGGDRRLLPSEVPLVLRNGRLILTASFEGWSWQLLKNTILAIRLCLFRKGNFREVKVVDVIDPKRISGQRYLDIKQLVAQS